MNASIAFEAFGSPSIPNGLRRLLDRIKPGDKAAKTAAGKSTSAVNRANHRQRARGSLPFGNSKPKNTTRPSPATHTQEVSQAHTSPAGSERVGESRAYVAYSAVK